MSRKILAGCVLFIVLIPAAASMSSAQGSWTAVYNDGCLGDGHRVLVGKITARATLGNGCDLVAGYVAPDQRYAGEWVWGYSPAGGAAAGAAPDDAVYVRPHICDVLPRFPWPATSGWRTHVVAPNEFLYALYGTDYPAYIAASCRLREQDPDYAQIGLDRALRPGSKLAEPPAPLVVRYRHETLRHERVALPVPTGRLTIVLPGDSLSLFAQVFGVPRDEIQAANHLSDPNALLVGQMLLIPGQGEPAPSPEASLRLLCHLLAAESWFSLWPLCGR